MTGQNVNEPVAEVRLSQFRTKEAMHTIRQINLAHNSYEKYRINYGR